MATKKIKAYKGFDKNLKCREFQFEIGREYEEEKAKACECGFHACEYPLDVFNYYNPAESRFCEVEQSGDIDKKENKTASTKIKIGAELNIAGLVKAAIEYTRSRCTNECNAVPGKPATAGYAGAATAGNRGAATAGEYGAATAGYAGAATAGNRGASSATGNCGASSATGNCGASSATGNCGASSATGYKGASSATGDCGASSATGNCGASSATGNCGASSATGYKGASSATGNCGASSATGYKGASSATGYKGASSATGTCGASSATGNCGASSATGNCGASSATGLNSIALAAGYKCKAKGAIGTWLCIAEREDWNGETYPIKEVRAVKVDGEIVKADTWYMLVDGELKECRDE